MRRRLFTILSALSLPICAATVVLWARSEKRSDYVFFNPDLRRAFCICSRKGSVEFSLEWSPERQRGWPRWEAGTIDLTNATELGAQVARLLDDVDDNNIIPLLLHTRTTGYLQRQEFHRAAIPYWLIMAASVAVPGLELGIRRRNSLRQPNGLCWQCGYDIRASPVRCPECGAVSSRMAT